MSRIRAASRFISGGYADLEATLTIFRPHTCTEAADGHLDGTGALNPCPNCVLYFVAHERAPRGYLTTSWREMRNSVGVEHISGPIILNNRHRLSNGSQVGN
mgnify:CR=1 FL=1